MPVPRARMFEKARLRHPEGPWMPLVSRRSSLHRTGNKSRRGASVDARRKTCRLGHLCPTCQVDVVNVAWLGPSIAELARVQGRF